MVAFKEDVKEIIKEEIPTARFWLMLKMKMNWDRKWEIYTSQLEKSLVASMVGDASEATLKKDMAKKVIEKIQRSAWATMPASFLASMKVERVIHR